MAKKLKIKTKKAKPTALEKKQSKLSNKVTGVFKGAGFAYLKTGDIHKFFGGQKGEIDHVFLYKNVIIFMEETAGKALDTNHLKKKHYYHEKLTANHDEVVDWLKKDFPEAFAGFDEFEYSEYKTFYAYASEFIIDDDTKGNFSNLVFIDGPVLDYFTGLVDTIKRTAKYEIFKFFGLKLADIGNASSSGLNSTIDTASVIPQSSSGFPQGVKVVTFAMNANELMECSYVLRKDGWDQSGGMYQRILDKKKIERIRKYLSEKKRTFIDSIIVSLPFETTFFTGPKGSQQQVDVFTNVNHANITISLPREINSIGIIDGQHRVFSHYEGSDAGEGSIKSLRDKRHLLVTGLFFDKAKYPEQDKRKLESEIFLQINSRQTNVNKGLLQYIESLIDPYSAVGIATRVVQLLNKRNPFTGMFALSQHDKAGIKVPSLSQYALQSLVQLNETDPTTLYSYWYNEAKTDVRSSEKAYAEYIEFCVSKIAIYFSAVKAAKQEDWTLDTKQSRLLSVTPVVAFLIAFRRSLTIFEGPQDFDFYKPKLEKLTVDFKVSKEHPFIYTSSQWGALADVIEAECWKA